MKNQNSKKQSQKQGKEIQMNTKQDKVLTPKEHSVVRMTSLANGFKEVIDKHAKIAEKSGNGMLSIVEVVSVATQVAYNYNAMNVESQFDEEKPKTDK